MTKYYMMSGVVEQAWEKLKDTDTELPPAKFSEDDNETAFIISTPSDRGDAVTQTTFKVVPPLLTGWSATAAAAARGLILGMLLGTIDLDE